MAHAEVSSCFAARLSFDELVHIFEYLPPASLAKASQVCNAWHDASTVGSLWKRHCLRRWNFCNLNSFKVSPGLSIE